MSPVPIEGESERVLDVACGTGVVAREVASRTGAATPVVAVDVNPAMLAVAREIADEAGLEVEWREGEAGDLPLGDASFEDVAVEEHTETTTYPSVSEPLGREAGASPLAGPIGALDDAVRDALIDDLEDALAGFTTPDGLTFPMRAHVAVGRGVGRAGTGPGEG